MKPLLSKAVALTFGSTLLGSSLLLAAPSVLAASSPRAEKEWLSQADAEARSARISNVAYQLDFTLTGKETFSGTTTLAFDLRIRDRDVQLQLASARVVLER